MAHPDVVAKFLGWFEANGHKLYGGAVQHFRDCLSANSDTTIEGARALLDADLMAGRLHANRLTLIDVRRAMARAKCEHDREHGEVKQPCSICGNLGLIEILATVDDGYGVHPWRVVVRRDGGVHMTRTLSLCRCGRVAFRHGRTPPVATREDEDLYRAYVLANAGGHRSVLRGENAAWRKLFEEAGLVEAPEYAKLVAIAEQVGWLERAAGEEATE